MVSVYSSPALPIVTTPVNYCLNSVSTPLTAIGDSLKWYTDSTISTPLSTAPTPLTTVAGQTCYFVSASKYTPNPVSSISAGDIAIIGRQNGATDAVQFVTLVHMPAGTVIYFTDNGWTGTGFRGASATDGNGFEGLIKFTSNAIIPAGNVILPFQHRQVILG